MSLPSKARYIVIGAGIHGLSTAYHLRLAARRRRAGRRKPTSSSLDKGRRRRRRVRHRLRGRAQQLLPAGDARADGAFGRRLGERPGGLQLPSGRLHADQPRGDARGVRRSTAAEGDRLRVGVHRGRSGSHALHEGPVRRLAGAGHHFGAAREARRLRQQHGVDARARGQGHGAGVAHPRGRHGDRLPVRRQRRARSPRWRPTRADRVRLRRRRRRARGSTRFWDMLDLPKTITIKGRDGKLHQDVPMWRFWRCRKARSGSTPDSRPPTTARCRR